MKKILVSVVSFLSFVNLANAKVYFSEYYKTNIKDSISDIFEIRKYMVYENKIINKIDMGYLEENDKYIKDENDFIYEFKDSTNKDKNISFVNFNYDINESNEITFYEIGMYLKIYEIEVYYDGDKIDFSHEVSLISNNKYIFDNNINDKYAEVLMKNNYITIKFDKKYDLNKLNIVMYSNKLFEKTYGNLKVNGSLLINKHFFDSYITVFCFNNNTNVGYKEYIKKYKYYKVEEKVNYDYIEYDENKVNDSNYKVFEEYYKRDKLELVDNIVVDSNQSLKDFIIDSSGEVIISCDRDIEADGIYKCIYKLNNISIEKEVVVNRNNKNDINENKVDNGKTNDIKVDNGKDGYKTNDIKVDNNKKVSNNQNKKINVINKVDKNKNDDSQNKKSIIKKDIKSNKKIILKNSKKIYFIKCGIFIFLLGIEVLFCIYKKK